MTERRRSRAPRSALDKVVWGPMRAISMSTWLALAVLVVTVTSLAVASLLSIETGNRVSDDISNEQVASRGALKANQIERYYSFLIGNLIELATGEEMPDAARRFSTAFRELPVNDDAAMNAARTNVAAFYRDEFVPELQDTLGITVSWRTLMPTTPGGLYLQQEYVVVPDNPDLPSDERRFIDDAADGSTWSEVHRQLHPRMLEIAQRYELGDLLIVDPATGLIVYSVAKAPDFATSLDRGPYGGSSLASLVRSVRENPERGAVTAADHAPYGPRFGEPVGFLGAPLYAGNRLVGILVLQIDGEALTAVTTADGQWQEQGFGETGEAYIVGPDGRMRTNSRRFIEDPAAYAEQVTTAGLASEEELTAMEGTGTTATFQKAVDTDEFGASGPFQRANYLGEPVLSSFQPLGIPGLDWTMVSEMTTAEIGQPLEDFRNELLIVVSVFVILITFATVAWSNRAFRPLRAMSERLRLLHAGETPAPWEPAETGPEEFVALAGSIGEMLAALRAREQETALAREQRLDTLRSLLPPGIAQRVESGDREMLDQIAQAGVVVLIAEGLGELAGVRKLEEPQGLLEQVVEGLDSVASDHGLERIKIVGDAYVAGCGLTHPYLDHAPRSVAFATDALRAYHDIAREAGLELDLSAGVAVGPVTLGLAGSARLVYDAWGETVADAHFLARSAPPGVILLSDVARSLLPGSVAVERWNEGSSPAVWRVSGERLGAEVTP